MKKLISLLLLSLLGLLLSPIQVFAVDFTISESKMDAHLQENGEVFVKEIHTYEFDGEFNGITREIIEPKGAAVTDFKAEENGRTLEVERDDETYLVYRSGEDETITVELSYLISGGVTVYEDMAEFYWPFFDSNNESDYENLTISVHPPRPVNDAIAIGYAAAYGTETVRSGGAAVFELGLVESGEDGNIRVAYDKALFPGAAVTENGTIREELIREQQELAENQANFLARQDRLTDLAPYLVIPFALLLLILLVNAWRKKQLTKLEAERQYFSQSIVPKGIMSMPATVYYSRHYMMDFADMLTVGMMDLVRKGNVEAIEEETYVLKSRNTAHDHEDQLIHILFDIVGENGTFSFNQLERYAEDETLQSELFGELTNYQKAVRKEADSHKLHDKNKKLRLFAGGVAVLMIPVSIVLGIHEIYMWLFFTIITMFGLLIFSFVYQTQTAKGLQIKQDWKRFREKFTEIEENHWHTLSKDDKERAMLFAAGMNDKKLIDKNAEFLKEDDGSDQATYQLLFLFTLFSVANVNFGSATSTYAGDGGAGYSAGSGTGVGGGGGGSGAF